MTPSPEAVSAATAVINHTIWQRGEGKTPNLLDASKLVDSALAPYRERVRRLVDAAERIRGDLNWMLNSRQFLNADQFDYLDAALAPFLEQETAQ